MRFTIFCVLAIFSTTAVHAAKPGGGSKTSQYTNCVATINSDESGVSDDGGGAYTNGSQCVICRLDDPFLRQGDFILDVNKNNCRTPMVRTASFNLDSPVDPSSPVFGTITTTAYFNFNGVVGVEQSGQNYAAIVIGIDGKHYSLRYGEPGFGGSMLWITRTSETQWTISTSAESDIAVLVDPNGVPVGEYHVPLTIVVDRQP